MPKMLGRIVATGVVVAGVFTGGILFGNGTISLSQKKTNTRLPADLSYASVEEVYDALKSSYDGTLSEEDLLSGLKRGLAEASGDDYTEYLTAEESDEFNAELNGSFTGIGAELSKKEESVVIVAPIAGFPAEKAGLKAGDIITEIDGETAFGISVSEAVKKIRGESGTQVKLKVFRDSAELEFEITRAQITIPSVESEIIEGNIGLLTITRFSDDTAELARNAAEDFKKANVKGVILDLRNNPGGLLEASVDVSSLWLNNKTVLEEKRSDVVIRTYKSRGVPVLEGVKTVVLINEGSASASEITAGALHDNNAATLIGETSYGKGSVQQIQNLRDGGALKVTIARWFTPNGLNIDKDGIKPEQEVIPTEEDITASRDVQKDAAVKVISE